MTKAGKLVKDMLKAKKESVMGKLGDSPYEDPMEPWSAKYNQPVKEEVLNEDGLLMKYIRSLGFNPEFMSFSQRSSYARSNAFKTYKTSHTFDVKKQNLKQEETVEEGKHDNRDSYQRDYDSSRTGFSRPAKHRDSERHDLDAPKPPRDRQRYPRPPVDLSNLFKSVQKKEETEQSDDLLDEAGNGFLMSFIKAKGLSPLSMDGNQKAAYSRSSEFKLFKKRHMKETSGMGERGDDWNEQAVKAKSKKSDPPFDGPYIKLDPVVVDKSGAKHTDNSRVRDLARKQMQKLTVKEEADAKDVVTMDIPLLIRVLEFIREDVKTDMDLHRVVENLIDLRTEGVLTMEDYDEIVDIPSKSVKEETISELKNSTLDSYIDRVATGPSRGVTQKGTLKSIKAIGGVTTALRKKFEKPLAELKKQDDNMEIDDRITREEVSPKGKKDLEYDERMKSALSREKTSVPKKPLGDYERKVAKYLKNKHGMSEGSGGNWYIRANGKILNDTKFKPVIFSSEDEARSHAMKHADKKRIPLSQMKLTKSWMDAPKQGVAEGAPELLKKEMPLHRHAEKLLAQNGVSKDDPDYHHHLGNTIKHLRQFGNIDSINKHGMSEGVKSCDPEQVSEGLGGVEDSPMSATNSVKAMESAHRQREKSKSARMIKSIYKKKNVKETMYDWEKDDKGGKNPTAKITMQGGTTLTGKPRDTVEIEPVLKTRPNPQKQ